MVKFEVLEYYSNEVIRIVVNYILDMYYGDKVYVLLIFMNFGL